jgi:1,2-diacylglycerol 3-alpha-glucosyltransferase
LRLLIATDFYYPWAGGPATFIENFVQFLAHTPHHVEILAPSVSGHPARERRGRVVIHRMPALPFPWGHDLRVTWHPGAVQAALAGARPDVVQIHHPFPLSVAALRAARHRGVPVVAVNHTIPECFFYRLRRVPLVYPLVLRAARRYLRWVLAQADAICTPTRTAARFLMDAGLERPVTVISNGVDIQRFHPVLRRSALREQLHVPDRPTVLSIGRLDPEKDMGTWLRAAALVAHQLDAQFVIGGTGTEMPMLRELAAELGLADRCIFAGYIPADQLPAYYAAADLYCITGTVELQSISTLEAMAAGLPVVAADAAALPELVRDGVNGYLAPAGDATAFATAIARVLAAPGQARTMGAASRQLVAPHTFDAVARQHLEVLERSALAERMRHGTRPP